MKNDIHEVSWPCDYWRRCCCSRADDGHCWGCGCEKSAHGNGDGFGDEAEENRKLQADLAGNEGTP